jgi:hypothetical protein
MARPWPTQALLLAGGAVGYRLGGGAVGDCENDGGDVSDEKLDEMLRHYHSLLAELQDSYRKAAQPYVKRILEIEDLRPRRLVIDPEIYRQMFDGPKCPCCNGTGKGPKNSNFADKTCAVCGGAPSGRLPPIAVGAG